MSGPGFAVIDFETTGLIPGRHDRVIEVAVVHVDPSGAITGQWETLINPARDLGRQHIHHIAAADIIDAPTFAQIAPKLVELLDGRVVVAHNATFDARFLLAEFDRIGYWGTVETLCTMQLAREFIPGAGRSLKDCCDAYGIELENAHRASADALAAAQLLGAYLLEKPMWDGWGEKLSSAKSLPALPESGPSWKPRSTTGARSTSFLPESRRRSQSSAVLLSTWTTSHF